MIVVACTPSDEAGLCGRLGELGARVVRVVAPSEVRRVVVAEMDDVWEAERVVALLRSDGLIALTRPDDGPRFEAWWEHTRPIIFDERLTVCFTWSEHDRCDLGRVIELGLGGFGNGSHATTRMLIEELLRRIGGGERVLDVGCGSGVLGLCALSLGASSVVAVDIKPEAVESTLQSAALNGMGDRLTASTASLAQIDEGAEGTFDVILANVGREAIVELAPDVIRLLAPGGWLAVSGISPALCSLVSGFLAPLEEIDRRTTGEWAAVVARADRIST